MKNKFLCIVLFISALSALVAETEYQKELQEAIDENDIENNSELMENDSSEEKLTESEEKYLKYEKFSPKDINRLKRENVFKYEQKINGKIFWIEGRVAGTRISFFGEYIIKLEDSTENPSDNADSIEVVIPKSIDEESVTKLGDLVEQGGVISILVKGRSGTSYVDIVLEKSSNSNDSNVSEDSSELETEWWKDRGN